MQPSDERLQLLRQAADMFEEWPKHTSQTFTTETTFAWVLTLRSVCAVCEDLFNNYSFSYVLTGKLQSDPIEGRFGCYRQMSGANFFLSIKQLLDAEKKLRVQNKLSSFLELTTAESKTRTILYGYISHCTNLLFFYLRHECSTIRIF